MDFDMKLKDAFMLLIGKNRAGRDAMTYMTYDPGPDRFRLDGKFIWYKISRGGKDIIEKLPLDLLKHECNLVIDCSGIKYGDFKKILDFCLGFLYVKNGSYYESLVVEG